MAARINDGRAQLRTRTGLDWTAKDPGVTGAKLGVSFGGMIALELALTHPDRVTKLALCCTSPGGDGGTSYPLHTLQKLPSNEWARIMVSISDTRRDADWAADHSGRFEEVIRKYTDDPFAEEPGHQSGIIRLLEGRRQHVTWERLVQIGCPVFICGGRYDGIPLPSSQEHMAGKIPRATLRMFEGGHQFPWEDSSAFAKIVRFLQNE